VSRGTTGTVELYHALRFLQSGEPLRAPVASIVGGLVTDFNSHGLEVRCESIVADRGDPLEVRQHFIQGSGVDRAIHPAGTVRGHLPPHHLQAGDQAIVGVVTLGDLVGRLIILNPEGDVPGCPVGVSVHDLGSFGM